MASNKRISRSFLAVGVTELALATVVITSSAIVIDKYLGSASVAMAFWALFYAIPGILCIVAGKTRKTSHITASLVFNIFSILLSTVGAAASSVLWKTFNKGNACTTKDNDDGECICFREDSYSMSCSEGRLVRVNLAVLTIVFILMTLATFTGSVLGCTKTCCEQFAEPDAVIMDASHSEQTTVIISPEMAISPESYVVLTSHEGQDDGKSSPLKI